MKLKENISIDEFDGKRYQIRLVEPNENGKAVLTHYLHNIHNGASQYYKEDALEVLEHFVTYKQEEEKLSIVAEDAMQQLLFEVENVPFPTPENYSFKFIDLFAGIGGFRLALQNLGGKCVFTSEWDKEAKKTYKVKTSDTTLNVLKYDDLGVPDCFVPRNDWSSFPFQPACRQAGLFFFKRKKKGFPLQSLTQKAT